jgi:hypothetical protein
MLAASAAPAIVRAASLMKVTQTEQGIYLINPGLVYFEEADKKILMSNVYDSESWDMAGELSAIVRRAFVPKVIAQIYGENDYLKRLLLNH